MKSLPRAGVSGTQTQSPAVLIKSWRGRRVPTRKVGNGRLRAGLLVGFASGALQSGLECRLFLRYFFLPHATFSLSIAICLFLSLLSLYSFLSPLSRARTWFLTLTFLQRSATRPLASRVALSRCRFHELESDQRDVLHFAEKNSFIYPQVHDSGLTVALASSAAILTINA